MTEIVKVVKHPDDPLCPRVSLGGKAGRGFYVVYRGSIDEVRKVFRICYRAISGMMDKDAPSLEHSVTVQVDDAEPEIEKLIALDRLIMQAKRTIAESIDGDMYLPVKEELKGAEHSLGFRKEMVKQKMDDALEQLKKDVLELLK